MDSRVEVGYRVSGASVRNGVTVIPKSNVLAPQVSRRDLLFIVLPVLVAHVVVFPPEA